MQGLAGFVCACQVPQPSRHGGVTVPAGAGVKGSLDSCQQVGAGEGALVALSSADKQRGFVTPQQAVGTFQAASHHCSTVLCLAAPLT